MILKQTLHYNQTLKQTLKLNQKILKSLDFLKENTDDINKLVQKVLETNPFIESKSTVNYDSQQFIESFSSTHTLKEDLYYQLSALSYTYDQSIMEYLIESLDDAGFLSYPINQYLNDLNINEDTLSKHLNILQSLEPCGVGAEDAIDSILIQLKRE